MMIHQFLRSVGFAGIKNREEIAPVVNEAVHQADEIKNIMQKDGHAPYGIYYREFARDIGIAVCGEYNEQGRFLYDYYFPYMKGDGVSTTEEISLERLSAQVAYAGMVDESRIGVSLIFYVNNMIDYLHALSKKQNCLKGATLTLSALAESGTIIMPVMKTTKERNLTRKKAVSRYRLIADAKRGNEEAMETLTLEDMDTYTAVSKKIRESDVFTLVDTYFMPFGVECDHYSVLGEIVQCLTVENSYSRETVYLMKLLCNDMYLDLCINAMDLTGEPGKGRRFKGNIWLQGRVNFVPVV
ncbi:MAG: DUF3881 family protein [Lachnospiraceae bacterium]|nr:DUF3881 family protein [Lachnospiraceae bacterium]